MATKKQKILRKVLNEEKARVADEVDGLEQPEIRLVWEREGIVDLICAVKDLRSTAVSRELREQGFDGKAECIRVQDDDGEWRWYRRDRTTEQQVMSFLGEMQSQAKRMVVAHERVADTIRGAPHLALVQQRKVS